MNRFYIKTSLLGLMYIRFDLYTSKLHILRKTYFDTLSCVWSFVFRQNLIMKDMNFFFVCVYELEQSTTNLSFIFYLKTKILNLQTWTLVFS